MFNIVEKLKNGIINKYTGLLFRHGLTSGAIALGGIGLLPSEVQQCIEEHAAVTGNLWAAALMGVLGLGLSAHNKATKQK